MRRFRLVILSSFFVLLTHYDCTAKEKRSSLTSNDLYLALENFLPQNVQMGNLHNTSTDITLSDYQRISLINQQYVTTLSVNNGGGGITGQNVTISNTLGPITFQDNFTNSYGGAIFSNGNCSISNNKNSCSFISNASYLNSGDNSASNKTTKGGAINSTQAVSLTGNAGPITFANNSTGQAGGAICAANCTISNNQSLVTFKNNRCSYLVGYSGSSGGAIYCSDSCTITNNPQGVVFANNSTNTNGGGISTKNLTIQNNGPVIFTRNSACWGAALISQGSTKATPGQFNLSADQGDIIFCENFNGEASYKRNALHSTVGLSLQIGARQGYRVAFYDPLENGHVSDTGVALNPQSYHTGTVLFSRPTSATPTETSSNYTSELKNTTTLANGTLAIENGAIVAIYKLDQTTNNQQGTVRLGSGGVLTTTNGVSWNAQNNTQAGNTQNCTINLQRLALDLPSLLKQDAELPKIWVYPTASGNTYTEDSNPTITLSGPLSLVDSNNNSPYDSLDLSQNLTRVPFLYLLDNTNPRITTTNLNVDAINTGSHYGYQGIWSPYWESFTTTAVNTSPGTANTAHRMLYADWIPTGYIPDPAYRGDLVANVLWLSTHNFMIGLHSLSTAHTYDRSNINGGALGAYISQRTKDSISGFSLFSRGYSAQAIKASETQHAVAVSFAQFYSRAKANTNKQETVSSTCYFAGTKIQIPLFYDFMASTALGYTYARNHLVNKASPATPSEGHFYSHALGAEVACMLPEGKLCSLLFRPFVKAIGTYATQEDFTETGTNIRKFSVKNPLANVTLPVGICGSGKQVKGSVSNTVECEVAYNPTVYRNKPCLRTTRVVSKGSWTNPGSHVDYHDLLLSMKNTLAYKNASICVHYCGNLSQSTLSNFLNTTFRIEF